MGDAPAHRKVSLGAAIIGAVPAPGFQAPEDSVPGSWVEVFRKQYADHGVLTGLLQSCTAGRDWVLTYAPKARLRISTAPRGSLQEWQARQQAAVQRAALRGSLPAELAVQVYGLRYSLAALELTPQTLQAAGQHFKELSLTACDEAALARSRAGAAITQFLGQVPLPNVTRMRLDVPCDFALPPPSHFPSLAHVILIHPKGPAQEQPPDSPPPTFPGSLGPYLSHIQELEVRGVNAFDAGNGAYEPWPLLFTPAIEGYALTSLFTDSALTGPLLRGIVQCAPALRTLRVEKIVLHDGAHSEGVWGVEELSTHWATAEGLSCLPRPRKGIVTQVNGAVAFEHISTEGLEPACIRGRLSEWNFKAGRIKLKIPHRYDQPQHQQQALTAVLQQLRELQADGTDVVDLHDCHWTAELAAAAASALPALEHLRMGVYVKELTDELLGLLLTLGPYIRCVGTDTLKLQSDQHANTPWPWEVLRVYSTALPKQPWAAAQLLRLPNPEHRVQPELGRPEVHCLGSMTDVTDAARDDPRLQEWLTHVQLNG